MTFTEKEKQILAMLAEPGVIRETLDVLTMWQVLELSFALLSEPERSFLQRAPYPFRTVRFLGFGAAYEGHYRVARHVIEDLGRFAMFRGRDLDAERPLIDLYRPMLVAFSPIRAQVQILDLTQVLRLIAAGQRQPALG